MIQGYSYGLLHELDVTSVFYQNRVLPVDITEVVKYALKICMLGTDSPDANELTDINLFLNPCIIVLVCSFQTIISEVMVKLD
jgi:hypothetical protein